MTFHNPMQYAPIKFVYQGVDITQYMKFSWSSDNVCWTAWTTYEQYVNITKSFDTDFWLRVLVDRPYEMVLIHDQQVKCFDTCIYNEQFGENFCADPTFDMYANLECALLLQQQMADSIICMLGIPIYYFRCEPDKDTADYTFKEFSLHNVVDCKLIKLMLQDGAMPSSNPKTTAFDFDWETDWEVELSKTQFAQAFGDTAFPRDRDFIYVPMMKRMWDVCSAYDEKNEGLLWRSTTWKLTLAKYTDSTDVDTRDWTPIVDSLVKTYEDTFGQLERTEQARETGYDQVQVPQFSATNIDEIFMEDKIRHSFTKNDIDIADKMYCHHNNIVARNIYNFKNENGCVIYQDGICGHEGSLSFIIETPQVPSGTGVHPILEFGPIKFEAGWKDKQFIFGIENLVTELAPFQTYLITYRWSYNNYVKELSVYEHTRRRDMPVYLLKPESYWFDTEEPSFRVTDNYNMDYQVDKKQQCLIHPYPLSMTNIKLYNRYMSEDALLKESFKYSTNSEMCVINDLARPLTTGRGYAVR